MNPDSLRRHLSGVAVTPTTPMVVGSVDVAGVIAYTEFLLDAGLTAGRGVLVPLSSTGEFMNVTDAEFAEVITAVVGAARGTVPIVAGANAATTSACVDRCRTAQACGADGVLVGPPFYWSPTADEIATHYRAICSSVDIGVLVYNNPFATQVDIPIEVLRRIVAENDNIVGIKETTRELRKMAAVHRELGDRMAVLNGLCEWNEPSARVAGIPMFVSMLATAVPEFVVELEDALRREAFTDVARIRRQLLPLAAFVFSDRSKYIGRLKAALGLRLPVGVNTRPPFVAADDADVEAIAELFDEMGIASRPTI